MTKASLDAPLNLRAVETELSKASTYYATDTEAQYLVSKAQMLLAHCRALRAHYRELTEAVTQLYQANAHNVPSQRPCATCDRVRAAVTRAAAVLASACDEQTLGDGTYRP